MLIVTFKAPALFSVQVVVLSNTKQVKLRFIAAVCTTPYSGQEMRKGENFHQRTQIF